MNKIVFVYLFLVTASIYLIQTFEVPEGSDRFEQWREEFGVKFQTEAENIYRRNIFEKNLKTIQVHNNDPQNTYKMGINQFTAYTQQEFMQRFLNHKYLISSNVQQIDSNIKAVVIDWTSKGAVGPVRSQGMCGGATLYSTLGGVQGLSKISTGTLKTFSAQQLIDCAFGCTGSDPSKGYDYYKSHNVCTQIEYPTTGKQETCQTKQCGFKITGTKTVNTCDSLVNAIHNQPVSVVVDASKWSTYSSGIFNNCGTSVNHMVLLTGLADEYWKCKNSWGTAWGESGYIRLARGNTCGICILGIYPIA